MNTTTPRRHREAPARAALLALAVLLPALALAGCTKNHPGQGAAASASARAYATSAAGKAGKAQAAAIAADCRHVLPGGNYQSMAPGAPGAAARRKAFGQCEQVPRGQWLPLAACIGKAYAHAPAKGAAGSPAETARQAAIETGTGACVQAARKAAGR